MIIFFKLFKLVQNKSSSQTNYRSIFLTQSSLQINCSKLFRISLTLPHFLSPFCPLRIFFLFLSFFLFIILLIIIFPCHLLDLHPPFAIYHFNRAFFGYNINETLRTVFIYDTLGVTILVKIHLSLSPFFALHFLSFLSSILLFSLLYLPLFFLFLFPPLPKLSSLSSFFRSFPFLRSPFSPPHSSSSFSSFVPPPSSSLPLSPTPLSIPSRSPLLPHHRFLPSSLSLFPFPFALFLFPYSISRERRGCRIFPPTAPSGIIPGLN